MMSGAPRVLASVAIVGLLALDVALPNTSIGRRGSSDEALNDVVGHSVEIGQRLPELRLMGLDGRELRLSDLLGHRVLLTFERSVDW
ncbi:MAG: hypothetical protein JRH19_14210 [Deltaproteobacteria bacterium]|nr:hypothetical protein [Deltaproteobacteria bacterium]